MPGWRVLSASRRVRALVCCRQDLVDCVSGQESDRIRQQLLSGIAPAVTHPALGRRTRIARAEGIRVEASDCESAFMMQNPRTLVVPQRVSGQHKLWNLQAKRVKALQSALRAADEGWRFLVRKPKA